MFKNWGFLLGEIWILLLLAALLGLFVGWLIWGRRSEVNIDTGEADRLRAELDDCRNQHAAKDAEMARLRDEHSALAADAAAATAAWQEQQEQQQIEEEISQLDMSEDYDGDGVLEGKNEGTKPETLAEARGGQPDDLKLIKGVGPKMEKLCNKLGFFHFDQIAKWTSDEVAWVDANLEGFKGRVSRDDWVEQAKLLAAGGETEFSRRAKGDKA